MLALLRGVMRGIDVVLMSSLGEAYKEIELLQDKLNDLRRDLSRVERESQPRFEP